MCFFVGVSGNLCDLVCWIVDIGYICFCDLGIEVLLVVLEVVMFNDIWELVYDCLVYLVGEYCIILVFVNIWCMVEWVICFFVECFGSC